MVYHPTALDQVRKYGLKACRLCLLALITIGLMGARKPTANPIVAFINPTPNSAFWKVFTGVMKDAAMDLNMELDVYGSRGWPTQNEALIRKILNGSHRPDYFILTVHEGSKAHLFEVINQAKVPFFVVDAGLLAPERRRFGGPRQHFKYWIGQMLPDNEKAGYDLTNALANKTRRKGHKKTADMVAFGGTPIDYAAVWRLKGLERAIAHRKDTNLRQIITANWLSERAEAITPLVMKRYPKLSTIWSANTQMAIGCISSLKKQNLHPGKQIVVGSIGWTPAAFEALKNKELNVCLGGNALSGGWAMALLYDYYHKRDFADEQIDWKIKLAIATPQNWQKYHHIVIPSGYQKIDFRRFSKTLHPSLKRYDFSCENLAQ